MYGLWYLCGCLSDRGYSPGLIGYRVKNVKAIDLAIDGLFYVFTFLPCVNRIYNVECTTFLTNIKFKK
jgi:hypothetical protein